MDSLFTRFITWLHDPFFYIVLLGIFYVIVFSRLEEKNETKLNAYLKNSDEVTFLPKVSVKHLQNLIGTRRGWFKADVYFTPHSIFVFGGSVKMTIHAQYYFDRTSPPEKLVWLKSNFIAIDKVFWDKNDLHICYVAPYWYKARCTTILKNVFEREETPSIQELLLDR